MAERAGSRRRRCCSARSDWLLAQQKADGSWPGDQSEFFTFQTSAMRNTAFVVWALASAATRAPSIDRGLDYVDEPAHADDETDALHARAGGQRVRAGRARATRASTRSDRARSTSMKQVDGDKVSWDSGDTQTSFYGARQRRGASPRPRSLRTRCSPPAVTRDGARRARVPDQLARRERQLRLDPGHGLVAQDAAARGAARAPRGRSAHFACRARRPAVRQRRADRRTSPT